MRNLILTIGIVAAILLPLPSIAAQGQIELSGRVRIAGKQERITRKRFYLIPGGLTENSALVERLRGATIRSRDCYYTELKASPEYVCWLQAENCESPFCRSVSKDDVTAVPEFQAAYRRGLTQFRNKDDIARQWITTNMPQNLTSGFYLERRDLTTKLLGSVKPIQSSMTDSVSIRAIFIDIPIKAGARSEKFTISNILPIEIGGKSYIWACELDVAPSKVTKLTLAIPEPNKPIKNCEVIVKDLEVCQTKECKAK